MLRQPILNAKSNKKIAFPFLKCTHSLGRAYIMCTHTVNVSWHWPAPGQSAGCSGQSAPLPSANPMALWEFWAEREGEEKGKGREGVPMVAMGKVYVTHRQEPESDSGRRRHRLSISCLWTMSAVCYRLSVCLYTHPLTSNSQVTTLCPVCPFQFKPRPMTKTL